MILNEGRMASYGRPRRRYQGFKQYGDVSDILSAIGSIFSAKPVGSAPYVPIIPPTPFFETGTGIAVIAVGGISVLGLGYLAVSKKPKAAPMAGYRRRSRRSRR